MPNRGPGIGDNASYSPAALKFNPGWVLTDLPGVDRECSGTYGAYPLDTLPLHVYGEDSDFAFVEHMSATSPKEKQQVDDLIAQAKELGLTLPDYFVRFMSSGLAQRKVPSCTACYFSLSKRIYPLPDGEGYVIKFLNDQQDCCFWYLHLDKQSRECVLCTMSMIEGGYDDEDIPEEDVPTMEQLIKDIVLRCSHSFEDFIKRFYIENVIWFKYEEGEGENTKAMTTYIEASKYMISKKRHTLFALASAKSVRRIGQNSPIRTIPVDLLQLLAEFLPIE